MIGKVKHKETLANTPREISYLFLIGNKYYKRMWQVPYTFNREYYFKNIKKLIDELGR